MIVDRSLEQTHKVILGRTGETTYQPLRTDAITHALETIDYAHHEIHSGSSFTAQYTVTTAATSGHRSGLFIRTPLTVPYLHLIVQFACSTAATYSICEAPTIDANAGTNAVVIYNRDRNNTKTSQCFDNATAPERGKFTTLTEAQIAGATFSAGTVIRSAPLQVGSAPKPAGGSSRDAQEYILKADTKYIFLLTNTTADANAHYILIDWYEHNPRTA